MKPSGLPILTYHALNRSGAVTATDPTWFRETIERLVGAGYIGVDLRSWVTRGCPEVEKGFAITFDDGLSSILEGVDALMRFHVPATIFLVAGHVGATNNWSGQPKQIPCESTLDWSEIRNLARLGFTLGAHTMTHPKLDRLAPGVVARELRESRLLIEAETNRSCTLLAYPYGQSNSRMRGIASRHFNAAFGTRLDLAHAAGDRFDLSRIDAYYLRSARVLDRLISGRLEPWLGLRRRLRSLKSAGRSLIPSLP